jgi:putative tryptophan/tyrosine transport system substrate-binding protein
MNASTSPMKLVIRTAMIKYFALAVAVFALGLPAQAQSKIPRIGILFIGGRDQPHLEAFKQGLRERGYLEGKNILLEYRYANGNEDRLTELASELVKLRVDLIVVTADVSAQAAQNVTKTIPIVMTTGDPVSWGLAESLARPGSNVTGLTVLLAELSGKRVEILRDTLPTMTRLATLWSPREKVATGVFKETKAAAEGFSLQLQSYEVTTIQDIEKAFTEMAKVRPNGLIVLLTPLVTLHSKRIAELALHQRLAGVYPTRQFAEEGGLMAYGPLIGDLYRRAATYVDKILKGAKPAELPIEQPTKFELVINLKTAQQIGLTIPQSVLYRADKVIR